jgi:threonine synthase
VSEGYGAAAPAQGSRTFVAAIDRGWDASQSIVLRYRHVGRFADSEEQDQQFKSLLLRSSIREGLRIVALPSYRGVQVDVLDATSLMHTRSVKSIDGCLTTAHALWRGYRRVVFESGGNTGTALTVYGIAAGLETFFFVPTANLALLDAASFADPRAHVIAVDDPGTIKATVARFATEQNLPRIPELAWRLQAATFIGYFLLELLLEQDRYDWLAQSISAAFGPIGIYRVLQAHRDRLACLPRFLGIQQSANCPMARAWRALRASEPPPPASDPRLLAQVMYDRQPQTHGTFEELQGVLVESGGDLTTLDHPEFQACLTDPIAGRPLLQYLADNDIHIALRGGEVIEKAGLMALAGTLREIAAGRIQEGSRVLVCLTGGTAPADGRVKPERHVAAAEALSAAPPPGGSDG